MLINKNFRGLLWEPSDEQEVVLLFGQLLDHLPRPLAIEYVQTGFPDCKAIDTQTGKPIWIEFKLYSSFYPRVYKKRLEKCDWIVCWNNDLGRAVLDGREIVALDAIVDRQPAGSYILQRRPPGATQEEYFQLRILGLSAHHQGAIRRLIEFAGGAKLQVEWPKTNGACFTIRYEVELFKVHANGRIGTPFNRWKGHVTPETTEAVVDELNTALKKPFFSSSGKGGGDIADLLSDDDAVSRYISVWQNFVNSRRGRSRVIRHA